MSVPNIEQAIIEPGKVRDYLLSAAHPVGRFKCAFFVSLGYSAERWEMLRDDILKLARDADPIAGKSSRHGRKLEVDGILSGPSGRSAAVKCVWNIRTGEQFP